MTATQTLKIYEVLGKYFGNPADATIVVTEIEQIVENKFEAKKDSLATKDDVVSIKESVNGVKLEVQTVRLEIKEVQIGIERRFNQQIIWLISTAIALAGFTLAVIKL